MLRSDGMPAHFDTRRFRSLVVVAIAIVAAAVLAMGLTIWGLRADATEDASRDVGHIATILAEQTAQSIRSIDESLVLVQERLAALEEASPSDFRTAVRSPDIHQLLADRIAHLPQAAIFAIVSAEAVSYTHLTLPTIYSV